MSGSGREGDTAAGDAHRGKDGFGNEQFSCAHQWSPWFESRTGQGSPEGHHGLSLTGEFAVVRRCGGRDR
jgi:hypothetical protein